MVFDQELVGQIFFTTNESKLADADIRVVNRIYRFYASLLFGETLIRDPIRPKVHLKFVGYADLRRDKSNNLELSARRTAAGAHYFSEIVKSRLARARVRIAVVANPGDLRCWRNQ